MEELLEGLEPEAAAARRQLIDALIADGATPQEIRTAVAEQRLALLPVERRLGGTHTAREVEAATGLPAALMIELRRLVGLPRVGPDDRVFSDEEVAQARSVQLFREAGFDLETLSEITRVMGESMARVTASVAAAFAETFLQPGDNELEAARRFESLIDHLLPAMEPVLAATFKAHLRDSVHRGMISTSNLESGHVTGAGTLSVCFADMVGFTRLGGELEVQELGSVATRLAALANQAAQPPVRLIKTIGDAAMLVSATPAELVDAALALIEDAEAAELPTLRAGIAFGDAVVRSGDYFGHSVNLASRVTGVARPGSVLCTQEVRDGAPDTFDWSYAGRYRLKGIQGAVPLHRARRLTTG